MADALTAHLQPLWTAITTTRASIYLQVSAYGFPIVESLHVIAITLVVGTIAIMDLRLIGAASNRCAVTEISRDTLKWTWGGFAVAIVTGLLLFCAQPDVYFGNTAFRLKMLCILLAGINMLIFERVTFRGVHRWDVDCPVPLAGKVAGSLSLLCWIAVVGFGRWIGFSL